jgi:Ca-activated chloride channel family protein
MSVIVLPAFAQPMWLIGLPVIAALAWYRYRSRHVHVVTTVLPEHQNPKPTARIWALWFTQVIQFLTAACMVVALAGPLGSPESAKRREAGIDLMMCMDVSLSMLSQDFDPDRMEVSKLLAADFIRQRPEGDRIGLVVFSGEAITMCPLTFDKPAVAALVENLEAGMLADRTGIGVGLALATTRLQNSRSPSKVVVLLTDGVNNVHSIEPEVATEMAQQLGSRVYTIGVGSEGMALSPFAQRGDGSFVFEMQPVEIDETSLMNIADKTGGRYFRAKNINDLKAVYAEIDRLEKELRPLPANRRLASVFKPWLLAAALLLMLDLLLRWFFIKLYDFD